MANLFNSVRGMHPKKNACNKSYRNTFTTKMGKLVPVYLQDCVPGTTLRCAASGLVRFQALLSPIMDNVNVYVHFWKIPYRLLDSDFPKWIGNEMEDEEYNPAYFEPSPWAGPFKICAPGSVLEGGLFDFLGYPPEIWNSGYKLNIRPLQAYALLLKHWYTNENLELDQTDLYVAIDDLLSARGESGAKIANFLKALNSLGCSDGLFHHAWAKDYFTSALPNVQAGDPVSLSLAGTADLTINNNATLSFFHLYIFLI